MPLASLGRWPGDLSVSEIEETLTCAAADYIRCLATRLADARAMGKDAAVLQGDRKTSAPISAKLGFEEVCGKKPMMWGRASSSSPRFSSSGIYSNWLKSLVRTEAWPLRSTLNSTWN